MNTIIQPDLFPTTFETTHCPRRLGAMRLRAGRVLHELQQAVQEELFRSWKHSIHHSWIVDIHEFLSAEPMDSWRFGNRADRLDDSLERYTLYSHERDAVAKIASLLRRYGRSLRAMQLMEQQVYFTIMLKRSGFFEAVSSIACVA